jgi:pimeloyl-ACP methyl ester carboxylesterase
MSHLRIARLGLALAAGAAALLASASMSQAATKPTIVLEHGAWANSASWSGVIGRLQAQGYTVDAPPNPLRDLTSDSAYLASYLKTVTGPVVLVGHSYGGAVITNAATGNGAVKALVYIDAYIPDEGDTIVGLTGAMPGSKLDPMTSFNAVPGANPNSPDLYVKQNLFPAIFAASLPVKRAAVLAAEQNPLAAAALQTPSGPPAWKTIPSWALIGTQDMVIPPAEQVAMTARAHSTVVKLKAPHLSLVTNPTEVTKLITTAASA